MHRHIPPLVELGKVVQAARALEEGTETTQDLQYLLGQGTSLGGARPKSTVRDTDGRLALGKFPSQADQRDVIRGEVLAMHRSEEHTSELQSLMRISYAVFCLKKKNNY